MPEQPLILDPLPGKLPHGRAEGAQMLKEKPEPKPQTAGAGGPESPTPPIAPTLPESQPGPGDNNFDKGDLASKTTNQEYNPVADIEQEPEKYEKDLTEHLNTASTTPTDNNK